MFKLTVAVLLVAAVGVQGRPSGINTFDCTNKDDGAYTDVNDPRNFFTCKDGELVGKLFCYNGVYDEENCLPEVAAADAEEIAETGNDEEVTEAKKKDEDEEEGRPTIPQVFPDDNDDGIYDDEFEGGNGKKKIFNIEFTKNVFPRSVVIIGKMNREQKNK